MSESDWRDSVGELWSDGGTGDSSVLNEDEEEAAGLGHQEITMTG